MIKHYVMSWCHVKLCYVTHSSSQLPVSTWRHTPCPPCRRPPRRAPSSQRRRRARPGSCSPEVTISHCIPITQSVYDDEVNCLVTSFIFGCETEHKTCKYETNISSLLSLLSHKTVEDCTTVCNEKPGVSCLTHTECITWCSRCCGPWCRCGWPRLRCWAPPSPAAGCRWPGRAPGRGLLLLAAYCIYLVPATVVYCCFEVWPSG